MRAALAGLKGGVKPPMASPAELATAIRSADYLARDARWPDPRFRFAAAAGMLDPMVPLSVLDLSPITEGGDAGQALRNSLDLARHVEALGYRRFWMAEHHNLPGIASAATAVALAHVAAGTDHIRIGAGGIMLPNHAPLMIAEQFGTLAALHPGRVELGLGRAPGSDQITARAVRRNLLGGEDQFPQDVVELMGYFRPAEPGQAVAAVPGAGLDVPIWILGSSLYRRAGRGLSRTALRLRLAFCAGDDDGRRSGSTASVSVRPSSSLRLTSCSASSSLRRNRTRRRGTCSRHCSNRR